MNLLGLKAKLAVAGAAALAFIAMFVRLKLVENQRDKAEGVAEVLVARHTVAKKQEKIKRKEEGDLTSRRGEIAKEIEKKREEFKGLDNLSDSNDY